MTYSKTCDPAAQFPGPATQFREGDIENGFFDQIAVQSALVPVLLGFVLTGAVRLANGRARGPLVAGAAVGLTFSAVYFLIVGIPPHPPVGALDKLVYGTVGGVVLGFVVDRLRLPPFVRWLLFPAGTAALIYWLETPGIETAGLWAWVGLGALWLTGIAALWRLEAERDNGLNPAIMLMIAALGLAAVAIFGGAPEIAHLAVALATALLGFALWNWPSCFYPWGAALLLGGGGALFMLAWIAALNYPDISLPALAVLLLVFFADLAARHMHLGESRAARAAAPIVLAAVCCVPVLGAVAIAYFLRV
jgi:UDP-N-acetylmuramyl pentapeptide phosphotransferase/UDP-N-acetylglucosamine-1-phosphate transferase